MRGRFRGEFEVTGGSIPVRPVLAVAALLAAAAWLATVLWILALAGVALLVLGAGAVIVLRRGSDRDREALADQAAGLYAEHAKAQVAVPRTPPAIVNFHGGTHLHITPGSDAAGIIRKALAESAVIEEERNG